MMLSWHTAGKGKGLGECRWGTVWGKNQGICLWRQMTGGNVRWEMSGAMTDGMSGSACRITPLYVQQSSTRYQEATQMYWINMLEWTGKTGIELTEFA